MYMLVFVLVLHTQCSIYKYITMTRRVIKKGFYLVIYSIALTTLMF